MSDPETAKKARRRERDQIRKARARASESVEVASARREQNARQHRARRAHAGEDVRARDRERQRVSAPTAPPAVRGGHLWWCALPPTSFITPLRLQWRGVCDHCGVKVLSGDAASCFVCGPQASHLLPRLPRYPVEWDSFINTRTIAGLSRKMNNLFCLTAMGVHGGQWMKFDHGISAVSLQGGRTYHRIIPAEDGDHPLRWMVYDMPALLAHGHEQALAPSWVTAALSGLRRVNPFIRELDNLAAHPSDGPELALCVDAPQSVASMDVAAIVSLAPACLPTPRTYVIRLKGETEHRYLSATSPLIEPLHYLLLFPEGTLGWQIGLKTAAGKNFTQMRWFRTRFFMNAAQMSRLSRLTGEWLVDAWSMVEESRLWYIRSNQHSLESEEDGEEAEYSGDGDDDPTRAIRLPSSFIHSPAWSAGHIADALALRRALGNITLFTTLTGNPTWPEILEELEPGQSANDRLDVVTRVFKNRLAALRKKLEAWFGSSRYSIRVIEFQKRGLPHVHMADALTHVPRTAADLDKFLSARVPAEPGPLQDAVRRNMIHSHRPGHYHRCGWSENSPRCKYKYPKPLRAESVFMEDGSFEPARLTEEDRWVVQHSPLILLAWDAHANTEYGASWSLPIYLFKYFYKGPDSTGFKITSVESSAASTSAPGPSSAATSAAVSSPARQPVDEIKNYERGRYLPATEAVWRLANYGITRKTPKVTRLPIHMPGRQRMQMGRNHTPKSEATLLLRYFDRPRDHRIRDLTYVEFGERCYMEPHDPSKPLADTQVLETLRADRPQMRIRIRAQGLAVARIMMVYPHHGDVFYLRAILTHRAVVGYEDARTVEGTVYSSFQEAAVAMGLFEDNNEGELAFLELLELAVSPAQLRWFFCLLAVDGNPTRKLWDQHHAALGADFRVRRLRDGGTVSEENVNNDTLCELQELLRGMGSSLRDIALPEPVEQQGEIEEEIDHWAASPHDLQSFESSLTYDQRVVYDDLRLKCEMDRPPPTYIDGRAGRGKTYCLYPLIGALRKARKVVLISASSAFAAKNYPGGRTVHYTYGIPVDEHAPFVESKVSPRSARAKLCLASACHIIDEVGALHYKAFSCADRLMRTLTGVNTIWGGRMLITLGDFRQTGPVVRYGGKAAVCEASLRTQPIFEQFHILRLTQSIRQAADPEFSSFLDGIGDDYVNDKVDLGRFKHTQRVGDVIDAVFPHEVMANPEACIRRAILSPFNDFVDELNEELLARIPGEEQHYYSTDSIEDEDGHPVNVAENPLATPDFLNAQTEPGTPPHDLNFKIGAIVRFVRNFSQKQGVTKNTRGIVRRLHRYSIEVETLPMTVAGQIVDSITIHVPRINFKFSPGRSNFTIIRKQLPIVLCYAVTFNGCQGLTVLSLGLDLRRPVFSHGQLYSAITRVPNARDVIVLRAEGDDSTWTTNIVWKELLLSND